MSLFYSAYTEMYSFPFASFVLCASGTGLFIPGMYRLALPAFQISVTFMCTPAPLCPNLAHILVLSHVTLPGEHLTPL